MYFYLLLGLCLPYSRWKNNFIVNSVYTFLEYCLLSEFVTNLLLFVSCLKIFIIGFKAMVLTCNSRYNKIVSQPIYFHEIMV